MSYNWSISTTLRNPERMIGWLRVVNENLVGETWNEDTQLRFQILLIQEKLYKPLDLTESEKEVYEDFEKEFSFEESENIFYRQNYTDPSMRGRNSFSPLKKMGLVKLNNDVISITSLGDYLLSDDYDFGYFLFRVFLKWEYKNPSERTTNSTFNINPFIGTLHLIDKVNSIALRRNDAVKGISKDEFTIFVQTLTDFNNIDFFARKLYEYRIDIKNISDNDTYTHTEKETLKKLKRLEYLQVITKIERNDTLENLLKNLKEYTDNTIRYFRLTRYLYVRGGGYYIDLEPRRTVEITALLNAYDGSSSMFEKEDDYVEYLSNINLPVLPWETNEELNSIADNLISELNSMETSLTINNEDYTSYKTQDLVSLKNNVEILRAKRTEYLSKINHLEFQDIQKIEECIFKLENVRKLEDKPSISLEKWTTMALHALNDSISINPNYPKSDDNEPLFTAPAGKPDIECFYNEFNSICEVTMLVGRDQWYNEGQPVMRHLRDFENTYNDKPTYCLFVAPKLHQDTVNTFWISSKYEYEGQKQKIVPLTINQLIHILKILIALKRSNIFLKHTTIRDLFNNIIELTNSVNNSGDWIKNIPTVIKDWEESFGIAI